MLRYRAAEFQKDGAPFGTKQLTKTDRNASLARIAPSMCNWASAEGNGLTRPLLEKTMGVHQEAPLPKFASKSLETQAKAKPAPINAAAPAHGRKALVFATCFNNHNRTETGVAALNVLAKNGVEAEVVYPMCCGMPQLEQGDIKDVADRARKVAAMLRPQVDAGLPVIALMPSCALMLKFEWPLIVPDDENVKALSAATRDITEYVVDIAKNEGLAEGLGTLDGSVTVHIACHARAQNMGQKAADLLRLVPEIKLNVIERCSGHGGSWGIMKENFEVGHKVGKPVARAAVKNAKAAEGQHYLVSECPLAGAHIAQEWDCWRPGNVSRMRPTRSNCSPVPMASPSFDLTGTIMPKTAITRADIMPLADYLPIRKDKRREMSAVKKTRRMEVGPFCTFYFESYETMWHQSTRCWQSRRAAKSRSLTSWRPTILWFRRAKN